MANQDSVFRVAHEGLMLGQQIVNTSHWEVVGGGVGIVPLAEFNAFVAAVADRWLGTWVPLLRPDYVYQKTTVLEIDGQQAIAPPPQPPRPLRRLLYGERREDFSGTGTQGGGPAGDNLPMTTSGVVHWFTSFAGRRFRGRMKVGPFAEGQSTGDQMTLGTSVAMNASANGYRAIFVQGTTQFEMVVFSRRQYFSTAITDPPNFGGFHVISHAVPLTWGVQRSRKFGGP